MYPKKVKSDRIDEQQKQLTPAVGLDVGTSVGFRGDWLGLDVGCEMRMMRGDDNRDKKSECLCVSEMTAVKMESIQGSCSPPLLAKY